MNASMAVFPPSSRRERSPIGTARDVGIRLVARHEATARKRCNGTPSKPAFERVRSGPPRRRDYRPLGDAADRYEGNEASPKRTNVLYNTLDRSPGISAGLELRANGSEPVSVWGNFERSGAPSSMELDL